MTPAEEAEVDAIAAKDVAGSRNIIVRLGKGIGGLAAHYRYPQDTDRRYFYVARYRHHETRLLVAQRAIEALTGDECL